VYEVCGFNKELDNERMKKGKFGEDEWFNEKYK
jgi:hypothetical protein